MASEDSVAAIDSRGGVSQAYIACNRWVELAMEELG